MKSEELKMDKAALYHRVDTEMSYLNDQGWIQIRLKTRHHDVASVKLIFGDPYNIAFSEDGTSEWQSQECHMHLVKQTLEHDYWQVEIQAPLDRLQYAFEVTGVDSEQVLYDDRKIIPANDQARSELNCFTLINAKSKKVNVPQWAKETVWYHLVIDRFANGNLHNDPSGALPWEEKQSYSLSEDKFQNYNFFGGDLQGVIQHLDYLQELGVTGLILSPLFKAYTPMKFDTIDHLEIDPTLGTKQELKRLIEEAHRRGMKVMLDVVFNYLSDASLPWQDVQEHGEASRFADWFEIQQFPVTYQPTTNQTVARSLTYAAHGFNPHMPKLNTNNQEVKAYIIDSATYWVKQFDIDGWHLEYAAEFDLSFLTELHESIKAIKPDFYLAGEVKHYEPKLLEPRHCDGLSNYPMTESVLEFAVLHHIKVRELMARIDDSLMRYRDQNNAVMLNKLESHVSARLIDLCHGDEALARAVMTLLFVQKGAPMIFYGMEVGLSSSFGFPCMIWNEEKQDLGRLEFVKTLIKLRKTYNTIFADGIFKWEQCSNKFNYLSFSLSLGRERIFALFNFGHEGIKFDVPDNVEVLISQNLLSDENIISENGFIMVKTQ